MNVITAHDLLWADAENTAFTCMVVFEGWPEAQPFACNQIEVGQIPYVTELWDNAMAGLYGAIAPYQPPKPPASSGVQPDQPIVGGAITL